MVAESLSWSSEMDFSIIPPTPNRSSFVFFVAKLLPLRLSVAECSLPISGVMQ
jgi:hypothetical protein